MQPTQGSSGEGRGVKGRDWRPESLPPLVSAALEPGAPTLAARIERLRAHRAGTPRYTVLGEVAEGGMGKILRAWDELLAREVAMKVVPRAARPGSSDEEQADHEQRLGRFLDEARITAQLDHPGIVPVYEIGLDETGAVFFTMPLVRGQDLKHVFALVRAGERGWTLQRAVDVVHAVCLTVAFAHSKGVVHRDLKPENIMVGPFGEAYVMDWGLALLLGRSERESIVGTPAYMAPEQVAAESSSIGPRADVYSLGAILYELLAGCMPHATSLETRVGEPGSLAQVLATPPRPLAEIAIDAPPELVAISAKAMARRPDERYASALAMAEDLAAWLAGRTVGALGTGPWTRLRKWRARNRALALALDSLAAVLLVGGAAFFLQQRVLLNEVRAKNEEVQSAAYAASLSAADLGLRAHDSGASRRRLAACEPELRGWEWGHLALRADASARVLRAHRGPVRSAVVSPDGRTLASGSDDGSIVLWDGATGAPRAFLAGHTGFVTALAFAPGGERLASASSDKSVRLWSVAGGLAESVLTLHAAEVGALAFSPDGQALATGDHDGNVILSRVSDGTVLARGQPAPRDTVSALAFVPSTGEIACAHLLGWLRLLDPGDLALRRAARMAQSGLTCLAVDPAGPRLALGYDRTALVLDTATLAPLRSFDAHDGPVLCTAFSPDGRHLATGGYDNVLRVFAFDAGRLALEFGGHDSDVRTVAFFPGGERLVTGSEDASLRLWDLAHPAVEVLLEVTTWVDALAFSPDGTELAAAGHAGTLHVFELRAPGRTRAIELGGIVDGLAWSRAGLAWTAGDQGLSLAPSNALESGQRLQAGAAVPKSLCFDPDGERLFTRDALGRLGVHALDSGRRLATLEADEDETFTLALSPDGRDLVAGTARGDVLVWDARTLEPRGTWRAGVSAVEALAYTPDGTGLAVAVHNSIALLAAEDGTFLRRLEGHERIVSCLAFNPDGSRLASGSVDRSLRVWNPSSTESLLTLHGHAGAVTAVAFDPSGELLASASKDGTVRLWRSERRAAPGTTPSPR